MKRAFKLIYLAVFLAICVVGAATMPFIQQDGASEKRVLAQFPSLLAEDGGLNLQFPTQFEDWLDDHIGLRAFWRQDYAELHAAMGASVSDQVIIGEDGWLYFDETIADYTGVGALTEDERWQVKTVLETLDKALDVPLAVMFVPNKSSVYPQYMPDMYPQAQEQTAAEWLLENCDAELIDVSAALTGDGLYHKTDTHWNNRGARIGAGVLIERLNALTGVQAVAPDPDADYALESYDGDLGQMLFPQDPPADEQLVYADAGRNYEYEGRYRTPEDLTITTTGGEAPLKLLMLRDSFTNLLIEPISNAYADVQYRRAMPLPLADAAEYDAVVLEMVERRIGELLDAAPVVLAPETEAWSETQPNCTAQVVATAEKEGVRLTGALDTTLSRLTALKVRLTAAGQAQHYDAFPVRAEGGQGFSLLIPELPQGAQIQVFAAGDGTLLSEAVAVELTE